MKNRAILFLLVCFFLFFNRIMIAQNQKIDSLLLVLNKHTIEDTSAINLMNEITAEYSRIGKYEEGLALAEKTKKLLSKIKYPKGRGIYEYNMGTINWYQGNYSEALDFFFKAMDIQKKLDDKKELSRVMNNIGNTYTYMADYSKALNYFIESLKIRTEIDDKEGMSDSYTNIGNIYQYQKQYEKALEYYFKSLKIDESFNNKRGIAASNGNIGNVYNYQQKFKESLEYQQKALKLYEEMGEKNAVIISYVNIAETFKSLKDLKKAIEYFKISLTLEEEIGDKLLSTYSHTGLADSYVRMKDYESGISYFNQALKTAKEIGSKETIKICYDGLFNLYKTTKNHAKALEYHELFTAINDSIYNETNIKSINEMQTKYDTEKKDKELIKKDAEINIQQANSARQKTQRNAFIIGFVLMFGLAFFIFRGYKQKKAANSLLEIKNETINHQNVEIEKKNTVITDSIEYAQNIQQAILPEEDEINRVFTNHFIFYKPKDIVSGDFYWLHDDGARVLFAVADCTGHGVPGAFMSFMGYNLLENIINTSSALSPSGILEELNSQILLVLKQKDQSSSAKFGMDISLIAIDKQSNMLEFSGAHNSMCISRKQEFTELKADKRSIGSFKKDKQKDFTNHRFQLTEGDELYMFTDGYHDQIGGPENKKYFSSVFKDLLKANSGFTFQDQKEILTQTILDWKGNKPQTDDMLVVGIKF